jgi:hypothetical protein
VDNERVIELYKKFIKKLTTTKGGLAAIRGVAEDTLHPLEEDPLEDMLMEALDERNLAEANDDPNSAEHNNVTLDNVRSSRLAGTVYRIMFEDICHQINKALGTKYEPEEIEEVLAQELIRDSAKGLPDKLYRGQVKLDGEQGFAGVNRDPNGTRLTFVSPEPAVAANYARLRKAAFTDDNAPTNYGDYIYEILTEGLDPSKLVKDDSSYYRELLFGPQYIYKDAIPQEDVYIRDMAGNDRLVPRIRKTHFLSDAQAKNIIQPHIVGAVRRCYG